MRWGLPLLLFVAALVLRTSGLSHDLHLGNIYHPDTAKQVRAVEQFLDDRFSKNYYRYWNNRDLDGYPFFNSHLVEHVLRGYGTLRAGVLDHLGVPPEPFKPDTHSIYWLTRLLNSVLSALAVVLVFRLGRTHFNTATGLLAALFLTLSPVDITTSNYAMSDSTAAFFALLAVLFAVQIASRPRAHLYILGGLAAACAFSAKYHGGMALLPLGLAHLLGHGPPRGWLTPRFWVLGLLLLTCFTAGVFVTTPSLLIHPAGAFQNILGFLEYTSGFGMTDEMRALPIWSRWALAMTRNIPELAECMGIIPLLAVPLALYMLRDSKAFWVIMSLPLFFVLVGLTLKPLSHPDYFVLVLPMLFLAAAAGLCTLLPKSSSKSSFSSSYRARVLRRGVFAVLVCLALAHLAQLAWREIFFFNHNDTRRVAQTWALDTIPRQFALQTGAYTFSPGPWSTAWDTAPGRVLVLSDRTPEAPEQAQLLHRLSFEEHKLTRNRNWNIRFLLFPNRFWRPDFTLPVLDQYPASRRDNMIMVQAPTVLRSPKVLEMAHLDQNRAVLVSAAPLRRMAVFLRNRPYPAHVSLHLGGQTQSVRLAPDERRILMFEAPGQIYVPDNANAFYDLRVQTSFNLEPVRVVLAASDREIARQLHLHGEHEQAFAWFARLSPSRLNVSEQMAMAISGLASGKLDDQAVLDMLPPEIMADPSALDQAGAADSPQDNPGFFQDTDWFFQEFGVHPRVFAWLSPADAALHPLEVLQNQARLLRVLLSPKPRTAGLPASAWSILTLRGEGLAAQGQYSRALAFFQGALRLDPAKQAIYEALQRLDAQISGQYGENTARLADIGVVQAALKPYLQDRRPVIPVKVGFANGVAIHGFQANALHLQTNQHLEVSLLWDVPELRRELYTLVCKVQLEDTQTGEVVYSGKQHFVRSAMMRGQDENHAPEPNIRILFGQEGIGPGRYALKLGLAVPSQIRPVPVRSPARDRGKAFALLTEIVVLP
jgi:tetratricopeptide (TPR) repeat protein